MRAVPHITAVAVVDSAAAADLVEDDKPMPLSAHSAVRMMKFRSGRPEPVPCTATTASGPAPRKINQITVGRADSFFFDSTLKMVQKPFTVYVSGFLCRNSVDIDYRVASFLKSSVEGIVRSLIMDNSKSVLYLHRAQYNK